jgi:catechol 2,3-dioxygenase-like lactoylglutathione lyase family enzyme
MVGGDRIGAVMMRVMGLDHVGLKARELEKTLDFYARLGLTVLRTSGPGADGVRSAVIQAGNQELNVFAHPDYGAEPTAQGRGVDHFCLLVSADSIQDVIEALRRAGIEVARGPVERRDGTAVFVHDPDGVRVELQIKKAHGA